MFHSLSYAWAMFFLEGGCITKKIEGNFMLKVPQPFSLQKTIHISIYLRNREKLMLFLIFPLFDKKIFSIRISHRQAIQKALQPTVHPWLIFADNYQLQNITYKLILICLLRPWWPLTSLDSSRSIFVIVGVVIVTLVAFLVTLKMTF